MTPSPTPTPSPEVTPSPTPTPSPEVTPSPAPTATIQIAQDVEVEEPPKIPGEISIIHKDGDSLFIPEMMDAESFAQLCLDNGVNGYDEEQLISLYNYLMKDVNEDDDNAKNEVIKAFAGDKNGYEILTQEEIDIAMEKMNIALLADNDLELDTSSITLESVSSEEMEQIVYDFVHEYFYAYGEDAKPQFEIIKGYSPELVIELLERAQKELGCNPFLYGEGKEEMNAYFVSLLSKEAMNGNQKALDLLSNNIFSHSTSCDGVLLTQFLDECKNNPELFDLVQENFDKNIDEDGYELDFLAKIARSQYVDIGSFANIENIPTLFSLGVLSEEEKEYIIKQTCGMFRFSSFIDTSCKDYSAEELASYFNCIMPYMENLMNDDSAYRKLIVEAFSNVVEDDLKRKKDSNLLECFAQCIPNGIGSDLFVAICDDVYHDPWIGKTTTILTLIDGSKHSDEDKNKYKQLVDKYSDIN